MRLHECHGQAGHGHSALLHLLTGNDWPKAQWMHRKCP